MTHRHHLGYVAFTLGCAAVAAFGACTTGPHASNRVEIGQDECSTCHEIDRPEPSLPDFMAICSAMPPDHAGVEYDTCSNCHTQFSWCPALEGGHPEQCFPLRGRHDTACLNCHDPTLGPSWNGQNTTCDRSGCHTYESMRGEHGDVSNYTRQRDNAVANGRQNFCLPCHWDGTEDGAANRGQGNLDGNPNCP